MSQARTQKTDLELTGAGPLTVFPRV